MMPADFGCMVILFVTMGLNQGDEGLIYHGAKSGQIPRDVTHVTVHPSVKAINVRAFYQCSQLTTAILGDGLEEIGEYAFSEYAHRYMRF